MEDTIIAIATNTTVDYLRPIVLQVLHESCLRIIHQIILVWRSTGILGIIKARSGRVWIRAKVVNVYILVIMAHEAGVAIARIVKGSIWITANRATTI